MRFCILLPDSCTPAQCEGQGTARPAAGGVTPGQAVAAMHKIASTDHRPPPICRDARLGGGGGGGVVEWSVGGVGLQKADFGGGANSPQSDSPPLLLKISRFCFLIVGQERKKKHEFDVKASNLFGLLTDKQISRNFKTVDRGH